MAEPENNLSDELANANLFAGINALLEQAKPLGELRRMDAEVSEVITTEDYIAYVRFKNYCLDELCQLNTTAGKNGALYSAIERGFMLGFWYGMQKRSN